MRSEEVTAAMDSRALGSTGAGGLGGLSLGCWSGGVDVGMRTGAGAAGGDDDEVVPVERGGLRAGCWVAFERSTYPGVGGSLPCSAGGGVAETLLL